MHDTGAIKPMTARAPAKARDLLIGLSLALWILPLLFSSTPSFIAWPRLAASLVALVLVRQAFPDGPGRPLAVLGGLLLAIYGSSWTGGWLHDAPPGSQAVETAKGLAGIAGFTVLLACVLRDAGWGKWVLRGLSGLLALLLACSLAGYLLPIDRLIPMGDSTIFFDPVRLPLIWPTRLLMGWAGGQIGWEHANHAGLLFGAGFIFTLERIISGAAVRTTGWWVFATLLGVALFLTGSRSALLTVAVTMPFILIWRKPVWTLRCGLMIVAVIALGLAALKIKQSLLQSYNRAVAGSAPALMPDRSPPPPPDVHLKGLVNRGSAGRLGAYSLFWTEESKGARIFGKGLPECGKPMIHLNHEHSSYLATFRGGGAVALLAHGGIVLLSAAAALQLWRRNGVRWPALLLVSVSVAILFDRSSVFVLKGKYEFLFHWAAVLCPLLLMADRRAALTPPPRPCGPDPAMR